MSNQAVVVNEKLSAVPQLPGSVRLAAERNDIGGETTGCLLSHAGSAVALHGCWKYCRAFSFVQGGVFRKSMARNQSQAIKRAVLGYSDSFLKG